MTIQYLASNRIVIDNALVAVLHNYIRDCPVIACNVQGGIVGEKTESSNDGSVVRIVRADGNRLALCGIFGGVEVTAEGIARGVEDNVVAWKNRSKGDPELVRVEAMVIFGVNHRHEEED